MSSVRRADLDYTTVIAPDGVAHARVRGVAILLCGRQVPEGAREGEQGGRFDCAECIREADLRGDRSIGVVEA